MINFTEQMINTNIKDIAANININSEEDISLDFSEVENIAIQDIKTISNIHKTAVINGKKLYIKNASPEIMQILAITGIHKTVRDKEEKNENFAKRQRRV